MEKWRVMTIVLLVASLLVAILPSFAQPDDFTMITLAVEDGIEFDEETLQQTTEVLKQLLSDWDATIDIGSVSSGEILVAMPTDQYNETVLATMLKPRLLEFVDFSMFTGTEIAENACILTTEQVLIAEALLPEGEDPPAYADYICASDDPDDATSTAALLNDGEPFQTIMTGAELQRAVVGTYAPNSDSFYVAFELAPDEDRVDAFIDYIGNNANHPLAIVLDGRLVSYPRIDSNLAEWARSGTMDSGIISGGFTEEEIHILAAQLNYGALPVPLVVVSVE